MTAREELRRLIDGLSDRDAARLLEELREEFDAEPLTAEDLAAIEEGLKDIQAGRTVGLEELKRKYQS
jgi:predicted transcriptional regulator